MAPGEGRASTLSEPKPGPPVEGDGSTPPPEEDDPPPPPPAGGEGPADPGPEAGEPPPDPPPAAGSAGVTPGARLASDGDPGVPGGTGPARMKCAPTPLWAEAFDLDSVETRTITGTVEWEKATLGAVLVDLVRPEDLRPMYGVECLGSGGFTLEVPVEVEAAIPVAFIDLGGDGPTSDDVQGQGAEIAASGDVEGVVVTLAADAPISGLMPNRPVLPQAVTLKPGPRPASMVVSPPAGIEPPPPDGQPPPGVEPVVEGGPDGFDGDECDCPPFENGPLDGGPVGSPDPNQQAAVDGPFAALIPPGSPLQWLIPVGGVLLGLLLGVGLGAATLLRRGRAFKGLASASGGAPEAPGGLPPVLGRRQVWSVPEAADGVSATGAVVRCLADGFLVLLVPSPEGRAALQEEVDGRPGVMWLSTDQPMARDVARAAKHLASLGPVAVVVEGPAALEDPLDNEAPDAVVQELFDELGEEQTAVVIAAAGAVPEVDLDLVEVPGGLGTADHGVVVRR